MMAMLGFLVFLFYLIYNYLNATGSANSGRMSQLHLNELNLVSEFWQRIDTGKKFLWKKYILLYFDSNK